MRNLWEQMMERYCANAENIFSETQECRGFSGLAGKLLDELPEDTLLELGRYDRQRKAFWQAWRDCVAALKQLGALA